MYCNSHWLVNVLFSPSLKSIMIVTGSINKGTKFIFNTSQVSINLRYHNVI